MTTQRIEAFSDGVIAILITIMVLELHVPEGYDLNALRPLVPTLLSYLLSFVFLGIYWNNHHHMFQAAQKISGKVLWSNHHLLFWLSLIPFATAWRGENHAAPVPTALYGTVLLLCAVAFTMVQAALIAAEGKDSTLARAVKSDVKGKVSLGMHALAIALAFVQPRYSDVLFVAVAVMWFVPDRRYEQATEP